jgi:hypothetical protein
MAKAATAALTLQRETQQSERSNIPSQNNLNEFRCTLSGLRSAPQLSKMIFMYSGCTGNQKGRWNRHLRTLECCKRARK